MTYGAGEGNALQFPIMYSTNTSICAVKLKACLVITAPIPLGAWLAGAWCGLRGETVRSEVRPDARPAAPRARGSKPDSTLLPLAHMLGQSAADAHQQALAAYAYAAGQPMPTMMMPSQPGMMQQPGMQQQMQPMMQQQMQPMMQQQMQPIMQQQMQPIMMQQPGMVQPGMMLQQPGMLPPMQPMPPLSMPPLSTPLQPMPPLTAPSAAAPSPSAALAAGGGALAAASAALAAAAPNTVAPNTAAPSEAAPSEAAPPPSAASSSAAAEFSAEVAVKRHRLAASSSAAESSAAESGVSAAVFSGSAPSEAGDIDSASMWWYRDSGGADHGPYPVEQMRSWLSAGYFDGNTQVAASYFGEVPERTWAVAQLWSDPAALVKAGANPNPTLALNHHPNPHPNPSS